MALKTGISTLALGALLLGSAAQADDTQKTLAPENEKTQIQAQGFNGSVSITWGDDHDQYDNGRYDNRRDNDHYADRGSYRGHVHGRDCRHGPQPTPPRHQQGSYELRNVQQWVEGRYEQVWVPEDCRRRGRWGRTKCTGGYYDQRWVEGHYETVQQWVWVPSRWQHQASPVTYYHY
jgi:hypothetical protein